MQPELIEYTSGMMHGTRGRKVLGYYVVGHKSSKTMYRLATEAGVSISEPRKIYWSKNGNKYVEVDSDAPFAFPVTLAMLEESRPVESAKPKINEWKHPEGWSKNLDPWKQVKKHISEKLSSK